MCWCINEIKYRMHGATIKIIRNHITYLGCECVEWSYVVQELWRALVNTVMDTRLFNPLNTELNPICQ